MDYKTKKFFERLGREVAKRFYRTNRIENVVLKESQEKIKYLYNKTKDPWLKKLLDKPLPPDKIEVDKKATEEIDKFYAFRIKEAIRKGIIPKPTKDVWMRGIEAKTRR